MSTAHESRPQADPGAAKSFGGDYEQSSAPTDITKLSAGVWDLCMEFYASGYAHGSERRRQDERDEVEAIGREAARIVHYMAGIPPRDAESDRAAAARRAARWSK